MPNMAGWLKNRWQAITEMLEFDFWEWLLLTQEGRAWLVSTINLLAIIAGRYISPAWEHGAIGALITSVLILGPSIILRLRKQKVLPETRGELPTTPAHQEIGFDYLPGSPIDHGWKQGYSSNPVPSDATWKVAINAPTTSSILLDLSDTGCAIDYEVSPNASLSTRLVCDANFRDGTAMLFVRVKLVTRDASDRRWGFIKFDLNEDKAVFVRQYNEWVLPIRPESAGNGWRHLDISLTDAVYKTWGHDGWLLSGLLAIRLRGHLSISPIKLY